MVRTDLIHWQALWRALNAKGDPHPWHERLVLAYRQTDRHYHNLQHLGECLVELDFVRPHLQQPAAVEAALWFHDAVYNSRSATNEEDSAALAVACLAASGVAPVTVEHIRQLVLCTQRHEPATVIDAGALIDIDLAILGQPPARFWEYEQAIRAEYAWVPAETFAQKRAEILTRFLQRSGIYRTASFRLRYEAQARANLSVAIVRLQASRLE